MCLALNQNHLVTQKCGNNNGLCIYPWIHMYGAPDGKWMLCCNQAPYNFLCANDIATKVAWNCESIRNIRLSMIEGRLPQQCAQCHILEESGVFSLRQQANIEWARYNHRIQQTSTDGEVTDPPVYLSIRFSNLCNHKCRTCSHDFSSSWYRDSVSLYGTSGSPNTLIDAWTNRSEFWQDAETWLIPNAKHIYFTGGEPLIQEGHFRFLDILTKLNLFDITLSYNTNLSSITFRNQSLIKIWKPFSHVHLYPSVDGIGKRGEYIRKGMKWDQWIEHVILLEQFIVGFTVSISAYNILHYPKLFSFLKKILPKVQPKAHLVTYPEFLSLHVFNLQMQSMIEANLLSFISVEKYLSKQEREQVTSWITFMRTGKKFMHLEKLFKSFNELLDIRRQESISNMIPELSLWYEELEEAPWQSE